MSKFRLICKITIVIVTWSGFSALGAVYNSDETATTIITIMAGTAEPPGV
jgi:hypothetical protein